MEKRTKIDFSQHELKITKTDEVVIYEFKKPDTIIHGITFINCRGILSVIGDFGNWIFNREFHPSKDGYVSDSYWNEKLQIRSQQTSCKFDEDETIQEIQNFRDNYEENYDEPITEEIIDWLENLENHVDDEIEYRYYAYRDKPSDIDYQDVPFAEVQHRYLSIIYDAFDVMCERLKEKQ